MLFHSMLETENLLVFRIRGVTSGIRCVITYYWQAWLQIAFKSQPKCWVPSKSSLKRRSYNMDLVCPLSVYEGSKILQIPKKMVDLVTLGKKVGGGLVQITFLKIWDTRSKWSMMRLKLSNVVFWLEMSFNTNSSELWFYIDVLGKVEFLWTRH